MQNTLHSNGQAQVSRSQGRGTTLLRNLARHLLLQSQEGSLNTPLQRALLSWPHLTACRHAEGTQDRAAYSPLHAQTEGDTLPTSLLIMMSRRTRSFSLYPVTWYSMLA